MQKNLYRVKANGYKYDDVYVHCHSYDEAARKALNYLIEKQEQKEEEKFLFDEDGSLQNFYSDSNKPPDEIKITLIELITDHIVF